MEHRDVLGQLSDRLPSADPSGREQDPTIVDLLSQIVDVNATLHTRLENAEGTLENQAAEISTYKSEARTDVMTGLANRRVFDELLRNRVNTWQRDQTPVFVLLIDIDYFKRFNDSYGHQAGDEVLTQVAQLLRESMSEADLVSRIGGEEFAVIIDGDCLQSALQ
ncbi:MAG: GGDEF domain-containing protein, partial [Pirellulaceae bacterium]|nr:GGDEF domain-containing protein [Pirellulaceae bacterium]